MPSDGLEFMTRLYWEQEVVLIDGYKIRDRIKIMQGVRRGCVLSPDLLSLYTQLVVQDLNEMEGIRIGGMIVTDDFFMIADSEEMLRELVSKLDEDWRIGLIANTGKTKAMEVRRVSGRLPVNIRLAGEPLKQVSSFTY